MTLGKGIGGGVPLAALLAKESVCCFEHGDQGGTYNGNPLMTAVGGAVMDAMLAPGFLDGVTQRGRQLTDGLRKLAAEHALGEVRGRGLLVALDLGRDVGAKIVDAAREAGLLLNSPRPATLRFMPALTISAGEIDEMLGTLDGLLEKTLRG
jgi:acetylornithine/N-succinyldiaminopimelate aminotransferase